MCVECQTAGCNRRNASERRHAIVNGSIPEKYVQHLVSSLLSIAHVVFPSHATP
jgi:hypothetical protein